MKQSLIIFMLGFPVGLSAQNVGIGTTNPVARLHVADSAVVFSAAGFVPELTGKTAIEGEGRRMMWHPDKAAFRAGYVTGSAWDNINIGRFSFAAGKDVVAPTTGSIAIGLDNRVEGYGGMAIGSDCFSGYNHGIAIGKNAQSKAANTVAIGNTVTVSSINGFAIGNGANVTGTNGFAIGNNLTASGAYSTTLGTSSTVSGVSAIAIGNNLNSTGRSSAVFGNNCNASGDYSLGLGNLSDAIGEKAVVMGNSSRAMGAASFAIGNLVTASGNFSTAMGNYVSTSNLDGAFAIGDNSTSTIMQSYATNGFRARFAGGYRLFTTSAVTIGAFLNSGANSWAALSDRRMKENFLAVDGEVFLKRIAAMPLTTWNYIGQEVKTMRHYGPMAQDFYAAFGNDALGEIGCDTLINQQDFLGVNLIAIQALEKRTEKINELAQKIDQQEKKMEKLEKENALLREQMNTLLDGIKAIKGAGTVRQ